MGTSTSWPASRSLRRTQFPHWIRLLSIQLSIMQGFRDRRQFPGLSPVSRPAHGRFRPWLAKLGLAITTAGGLWGSTLVAQAAPSEQQIVALAEALRQLADEGPGLGTGVYYSDWQIESSTIPQWSQSCLGRSLTPMEFATSQETAQAVVLCKLRAELTRQYEATQENEALAVRRVVAWWRTGDASRYDSGPIAPFAQSVLSLYQQLTQKDGDSTDALALASPLVNSTRYDRYMASGYAALRNGDSPQAMINFQRALDERPGDTFAKSALGDAQRSSPGLDLNALAEPESADRQYWQEIATNAVGDRLLVAPSSIQPMGDSHGYWEYRAFRGANNAFLARPTEQPVRGVLVYRLANCEAGTTQARMIRAQTDDHEEIFEQDLGLGAPLETPWAGSSTAQALTFVCDRAQAASQRPSAPREARPGSIEGQAHSSQGQ